MATYPTVPKIRASGTSKTQQIKTLRSETEGAYTKVRRVSTKAKKKFKLGYKGITKDEFAILETFFNENQGLSFDFVYPGEESIHIVIFAQDEITQTEQDGVLVSTSIELEEI